MRYSTAFAIVAVNAGFWGLVFWAADAFGTAEIATVVGLIVLVAGVWLAYEVRHAAPDPHERDLYVPADWDWFHGEDRSEVRHGGLGR